nr:immunoglobulin heavy chain junction region [Mus musculus]MBK4184773.1 immunoglobulin heavy chain junction region [Mus musculus]MBK4184774.1 immunoglobulin heavy chain junction region [Mus musculus]MBK4184775.1 immunoglobulin heavy chain junction region [Mus musculus]MBK4184776.1 immunoglobulin heavy chain junction region [Mus musculus]
CARSHGSLLDFW